MKKLRAAVVGVGYLGTFHAQKYKNNPNVELVGVCDVYQPQAEKVAAELGVKAFQSPKDLIGFVDLVTIATTTKTHFEVAQLFLANGIHVNVEKPIAANISDAEKMVQLALEKKLKLSVGHVERFNPVFQELKTRVKNPLFIEMQRLAPFKPRGADVSVVHDLMIHDIDLLWSLLGNANTPSNKIGVKNIHAAGNRMRTQELDWTNAWFEFSMGVKASINVSRVSEKPVRQIKVFEKDQFWVAHLGNLELERVSMNADVNDPLRVEKIAIEKKDALQLETDAFVNAVIGNSPVVVSGQDGLEALIQVEAVVKAASV